MTEQLSSPCPVARACGNLKCVSLRASTRVSLSCAHTQACTSIALVDSTAKKCARMLASLVRGSTRVDASAARNTRAQPATRRHRPATRRDRPAVPPRQGGNQCAITKNSVVYTQKDRKNPVGFTQGARQKQVHDKHTKNPIGYTQGSALVSASVIRPAHPPFRGPNPIQLSTRELLGNKWDRARASAVPKPPVTTSTTSCACVLCALIEISAGAVW